MRLATVIVLAALAAQGFGQTPPARTQGKAGELAKQIREAGLDGNECYRVRDLEFAAEDARFFLSSGYLTFGKPVNGLPLSAVFTADEEGGDAEVLLLPPDRPERRSLAAFTQSPNLDEHFSNGIFLFTDDESRHLRDTVRASGAKQMPEMGALVADKWNAPVGAIAAAFDARMVLDLLDTGSRKRGFFDAIIQGRTLGNFDVIYDPRGYEQISAGQVVTRNGRSSWDTWTSFTDREHRGAAPAPPEETILSYRIEAALDKALLLSCVTRVRVRVTGDSRFVLPFDIAPNMRAVTATVDGAAADVYQRDSARNGFAQAAGNELLLVIPAQPLEPGSEHEVEIRHAGQVASDTGHKVFYVEARGSWYPNRGGQFATYDVTYRYPKGLDLVSAGRITEDRTEGDVHVTRHVPDGKIRMVGFNVGQYEREVVKRGAMEVQVSANREIDDALRPRARPAETMEPPIPVMGGQRPRAGAPATVMTMPTPVAATPRPADELARIADEVAAAAEFYRTRFGPPPVSGLEVSPVPGRFGQGFAGMIYVSTLTYLPLSAPVIAAMPNYEKLFYSEIMPAHEAAHQWWGNVVTVSSYHHEWLMEAMANYSAAMFLEARHGAKFLDMLMEEYRKQLLAKSATGATVESEGPVVQGWRLENLDNPNAWAAIVYGKGTWILHMLRRRMGDARFLAMMKEVRQQYEYRAITTEDFRLLAARFLPANSPDPKLEEFFDQWVYNTGIPALKLSYTVENKAGVYTLQGKLEQSEAPEDLSLTVPVEIQTGKGAPVVKLVRTGEEAAKFSVPVAGPNAKAVLDPAGSVLRR